MWTASPTGRAGPRAGRLLMLAAAGGLASLPYVCAAHASPASPPARAARTLNVTDEAHLRVVHTDGEEIEEEGQAKGALPGRVRGRFTVGTSTVSGSFTIYPHSGGSISGHGSARAHYSTGVHASFGGTLTVSHGTGPYAHARGSGGLYGAFNRRTDAMIVQTTGHLSY